MSRFLRSAVCPGLALGTLLASVSCGSQAGSSPGANDAIKVGVIPIVDVAPIYLGKEKGFFRQQHIDLTLVSSSGGSQSITGAVSGQFQFAFGNVTSLLIARDKGLDVKMVTSGNASTGKAGADFGAVVVPADSHIQSAKDLAGKTVAVNNLNNIGDTTVRASVTKAGGNASSLKFVELAFPDMPAAVTNHHVDAAWVVEPFLTAAQKAGARVVAWNFVDAAPNLTVATYFTTGKEASSNPNLVARFKTAMAQSLQYAQSHPDEVRRIVTTYTKITADVAQKITLPDFPPDVNRASIKVLADLLTQSKAVSKPPDLNALLP